MSIPSINERFPTPKINRERLSSGHRTTVSSALVLGGFALFLGLLTSLHVLDRDSHWVTENALLILVITILAAWSCPQWLVLTLTLISGGAWGWTDLDRGPEWSVCLTGHAVRIAATVLLVIWAARARRLLMQARHFARVDGLTGLPNRQAILEALDAEMGRGRRFGRAFSIAMLDCDEFKAINDLQGHLVGDRVLQSVAVALRKSTRAYDCIGRLAGDEFVLILSEANIDEIPAIIERLRATLRHELGRENPSLTFSIGVVTIQFSIDSENSKLDQMDCLQRADDAMYVAKRSGPDQTRFEILNWG